MTGCRSTRARSPTKSWRKKASKTESARRKTRHKEVTMSATPTTPTPAPAPGPKTNHIGLTVLDYRGGKTTLCAGCGHNAISERIIDACYEMGIDSKQVIKLSGICCCSKSPAYFLSKSHVFNSAHRPRPWAASAATLANSRLVSTRASGD